MALVTRCLSLFALLIVLTSCAGRGPLEGRTAYAERLAREAAWESHRITAGRFVITGFSKGLRSGAEELVVYLETDGFAWRSRRALSSDPSPKDPQGLRLALRDPGDAVLYLARPCQFSRDDLAGCDPIYWSSHRYGEAVVAAVDEAIEQAKAESGATRLALIGVSGGGVVAALLAARRDDVERITTLAANLDHAAWTRHHDVSPLTGSLNPADLTERLQRVPQTHFVGADDEIVPPLVVESYLARMSDRARTRMIVVPDFDHDCCWVDAWPALLSR